jgi:hypothetical protein
LDDDSNGCRHPDCAGYTEAWHVGERCPGAVTEFKTGDPFFGGKGFGAHAEYVSIKV